MRSTQRTWLSTLMVAGLSIGSWGCLSVEALTKDVEDAGPGDAGGGDASEAGLSPQVVTRDCLMRDRDPLVGLWHLRGNESRQCEFFSNGRYTDNCGLISYDTFEWDRLEDGRYFFNATNSLGSIIDTCTARPTFEKGCDAVDLALECEGDELERRLVRVEGG